MTRCWPRVLARWRGVHPSTYSSLYEYLVISTLLQNATVRRTVQMAENLFGQYGRARGLRRQGAGGVLGPGADARRAGGGAARAESGLPGENAQTAGGELRPALGLAPAGWTKMPCASCPPRS